jgi:hypothetical protein
MDRHIHNAQIGQLDVAGGVADPKTHAAHAARESDFTGLPV